MARSDHDYATLEEQAADAARLLRILEPVQAAELAMTSAVVGARVEVKYDGGEVPKLLSPFQVEHSRKRDPLCPEQFGDRHDQALIGPVRAHPSCNGNITIDGHGLNSSVIVVKERQSTLQQEDQGLLDLRPIQTHSPGTRQIVRQPLDAQ